MLSMLLALLLSVIAGCTASSQEPVEYDAVAIATPASTVLVGQWSLELSSAELAFGPAYFCASASGSSSLCEASNGEVTSIVRLDALSGAPQALGRVHGFTGTIRSVSYDCGITWFDTQTEATVAGAAPGGHSLHLEAVATRGTTSLPLTADVDVVPQYQGQMAVPTAAASATVDSSAVRLEVHFDLSRWLGQLDRVDPLGVPLLDALAAPGGPIQIRPGMPEHEALMIGMKNLAPPEFRWVQEGR